MYDTNCNLQCLINLAVALLSIIEMIAQIISLSSF